MQVSCDVFGEKVESELFDLNNNSDSANDDKQNSNIEDKPINDENGIVENEEAENTEKQYANWMNYLLEKDIQEIKVTRTRRIDFNDEQDYHKTVELTLEELKEQFVELNTYEINNIYIVGNGGPSKDAIEIVYLANGQTHKFNIYDVYISTDDTELLNIFNNNNYKESGLIEHKDLESVGRVLAFTSKPFSIFDEYFEAK